MEFYNPRHGDTAAAVADGYDSNFQTLDTSKADAEATLAALDTKVDKVDGAGLMTDPEREKLAGIEAGSNNYIHPQTHPADLITDTVEKVVMTAVEREKLAGVEAGANAYSLPPATANTLGGVKAGANVTIAEDGTLSATAEPYELPKASPTVLGGIKVGNNLSIRADGTLDAPAGGDCAVIFMKWVEPTFDTDPNVPTNQQAYIDAWGPAIAAYSAAPERSRLVINTPFFGGTSFKMDCQAMPETEMEARVVGYVLAATAIIPMPDENGNLIGARNYLFAHISVANGLITSVDSFFMNAMINVETGAPNHLLDNVSDGGGSVAVSPDAGNTLQQRENGLFVPAGTGGGSGSGAGLLVLPYVAPERDAEGNITNSAAFVTAWGAILSQYLASPQQYSLCLEMDVTGGDGALVQMPCNMLNLGGDGDAVQWLLSGFTVVNMPVFSTTSASCKATCMMVIVCNAAGQMQSVEMCANTGIVGSDGQPNLLGVGAQLVFVSAIHDNSTLDEVKAIMQPVVDSSIANENALFVGHFGYFKLPGCIVWSGDRTECLLMFSGNHNVASSNINNLNEITAVVARYYISIKNGQITSVKYKNTEGFGIAFTEIPNINKVSPLPPSLTEQLVPGEYWMDADGVNRQVYQRTFKGTLPTTPLEGQWLCPLTQGLRVVPVQAKGWVSQENWGDPYLVPNSKVDIISKGWYGLSMIFDSTLAGREYHLTAKYTKA